MESKKLFLVFISALIFTAAGQLAIICNQIIPGSVLYIIGFLIALMFGAKYDFQKLQSSASSKKEVLGVFLVMVIAFSARIWQLGTYPGANEDEVRWLSTAYQHFIQNNQLGEYDPWIKQIPVAFYQVAVFLKIFGSNLVSGRLALTLASLTSIFLFYLLARSLFRTQIALIATALLSTSWIDLATSRVAIFDNFVKLPVVGSYLFLILALKSERKIFFLLSGIFLAMGLLTFINFHLTPFIVVGYLLFYSFFIKKWQFRKIAVYFSMVVLPILIVYQPVISYFKLRFPEKSQHLQAALFTTQNVVTPTTNNFLIDNSRLLLTGVFKQVDYVHEDMSYPSHKHPYDSSIIVPLAIVGLGLSLTGVKNNFAGFPGMWLLFQLLPFPIILSYFGSRIILPAWPAIFLLSGITLSIIYNLGRQFFAKTRFFTIILVTLLAGFIFGNGYFYFYKIPPFYNEITRKVRGDLFQIIPEKINQKCFTYLVYRDPPPGYVSLFAEKYFLGFMASPAQNKYLEKRYELIPETDLDSKLKNRIGPACLILSKAEYPDQSSFVSNLIGSFPQVKLENHQTLW